MPLKGLPLGSPGRFVYRRQCVFLSAGDTVVFMSDGFPELFNATGQMLGYEGAVEVFRAAVGRSPEEVIVHLKEAAKAWCDGRGPGDDLMFLVMKVKA